MIKHLKHLKHAWAEMCLSYIIVQYFTDCGL